MNTAWFKKKKSSVQVVSTEHYQNVVLLCEDGPVWTLSELSVIVSRLTPYEYH